MVMCLCLVTKKKYKTKYINLASILKDLYFKVKKFRFYFYFKLRASFKIPCLSAPTESTPESSPVKIWPAKPLPAKKVCIFYLPHAYYII